MGTLFQEVYDSFIAKIPDEDFTYKSDLAYQYLKTANGYAYKTVPEDLTCTLYTDNAVIYISNIATTTGNITVTINSIDYTISVLTVDTLVGIANKIKSAINATYTVETNYDNTFPMLTITKSGVDTITASYVDTGSTGIKLNITKSYDGTYNDTLSVDSIELISLFMAKQYYIGKLTSLESTKQHVGTQNFSKLPNLKEKYDNTRLTLKDIEENIYKFRQEFYTYKN